MILSRVKNTVKRHWRHSTTSRTAADKKFDKNQKTKAHFVFMSPEIGERFLSTRINSVYESHLIRLN